MRSSNRASQPSQAELIPVKHCSRAPADPQTPHPTFFLSHFPPSLLFTSGQDGGMRAAALRPDAVALWPAVVDEVISPPALAFSACSHGDEAPWSHPRSARVRAPLRTRAPQLDTGLRRRLLAGAPSLAPSGMPPSTRPFALPLRPSSACSHGDEVPWPRPSSARAPLRARVRIREGAGRQQLASIGSRSRRRATAHCRCPAARRRQRAGCGRVVEMRGPIAFLYFT